MDSSLDDLEKRLRRHSAVFVSLAQLIPARYYHTPEEEEEKEEEESGLGKFFRNKRNRAPKQAIKEASKRAKRLKFDPAVQERVQEFEKKHEESKNDSEESEEVGTVLEGEYCESSGDHPSFSVERVKSRSLPELRERLRDKIAELRSKRKAPPENDSTDKSARYEENQPHKQRQKKKKRKIREKETTGVSQIACRGSERPSIEDKGQLVFSKFDFSVPLVDREKTTKRTDYKRLLARAEAKQKKLEELTEQDLRKGQELQEQLKWRHALEQAGGRKMKDSPALLRKTLKRVDKQKSKSRKEWKQRKDQERRKIEKHQEARQKHIEERIEQKKAKAAGKRRGGKAKRRSRKPGF